MQLSVLGHFDRSGGLVLSSPTSKTTPRKARREAHLLPSPEWASRVYMSCNAEAAGRAFPEAVEQTRLSRPPRGSHRMDPPPSSSSRGQGGDTGSHAGRSGSPTPLGIDPGPLRAEPAGLDLSHPPGWIFKCRVCATAAAEQPTESHAASKARTGMPAAGPSHHTRWRENSGKMCASTSVLGEGVQ